MGNLIPLPTVMRDVPKNRVREKLVDWDQPDAGDEARWQAVRSRDRAAADAFVYAVTTTGIYCRPGCTSRRPQKRHVRFFDSPAEAETAGFRACKRCRPNSAPAMDGVHAKVLEACRYIQTREERPPKLAEIGAHVGLSPSHLQRVFKRVLGLSPRQYADALRMERVKADLRAGRPIASALYGAGFGSTSRLYERSASELGMTPGRYRKGGEGEEIHYTIIPSPLGHVMVARTRAGICRVALGEGPRVLEEDLRRELPRAVLRSGGPEPENWVRPLEQYLSGHLPLPDLPLDVQATAFQRRVWETLRAIPEGTTRSYEEVAREIGEPKATRAVAQACAKNPAALVIPCHRVVRKNGELGGYRWGPEIKGALLELERRLAVVLSADVVGYSRLMAHDPDATVRALTALRKRIGVLIEARRGRVVDTAGDNILAVFPSATDAIRSAVMIQRVLERHNAEFPTERRMELRIGVHVGELIVEGERVYGDGVNIAARLERLAEPGGICISAAVRDLVSARLDLDCDDLGEQVLHNIPVPVRAYSVRTSRP